MYVWYNLIITTCPSAVLAKREWNSQEVTVLFLMVHNLAMVCKNICYYFTQKLF